LCVPSNRLQTVISVPSPTQKRAAGPAGACAAGDAVHALVFVLMAAPAPRGVKFVELFAVSSPPHTTIEFPVHTAVCDSRGLGAPVVVIAVHEFPVGLYRPPVFTFVVPLFPPQTSISVPVHTAV